jgi:hypothetical protein
MNLGSYERLLCLGLGVALLTAAINRGTRRVQSGAVGLALVGGALLSRGVTGYCPAYHALGIDTRQIAGAT